MEKRIYDIAVGEMFTFKGALFVMSPFDPDEEKYLSLCVASSNVGWEIGESYWIDVKKLERLFLLKSYKPFFFKGLDKRKVM